MLTITQLEALRRIDPQLYESVKRLAEASLGPHQGWSLDEQIVDGSNYARVAAEALTNGQIDPSKAGVLTKGSIPPTWSDGFTYVSTPTTLTWSWTGLTIYRADGSSKQVPTGSVTITGLTGATTYYFYPFWDESQQALTWIEGGYGAPAFALGAKTNFAAQQQALQGRVPLSQDNASLRSEIVAVEGERNVAMAAKRGGAVLQKIKHYSMCFLAGAAAGILLSQ